MLVDDITWRSGHRLLNNFVKKHFSAFQWSIKRKMDFLGFYFNFIAIKYHQCLLKRWTNSKKEKKCSYASTRTSARVSLLCLPLLSMKAAGCEWALLSPEGTYHKLSEPNFFVGREDEMDLTLKVGLRWISFATIDLEFYVILKVAADAKPAALLNRISKQYWAYSFVSFVICLWNFLFLPSWKYTVANFCPNMENSSRRALTQNRWF